MLLSPLRVASYRAALDESEPACSAAHGVANCRHLARYRRPFPLNGPGPRRGRSGDLRSAPATSSPKSPGKPSPPWAPPSANAESRHGGL